MTAAIEIHGFRMCPFAFRSRLTAREKGVSFDWFPADAPEPDPRSLAHNPAKRSPLLWQDGFVLTESAILIQYIDEAFEGPALQPRDPKQRAQLRLTALETSKLMFDGRKELTPEGRTVVEGALRVLEAKLASGQPWLGGDNPALADIELWPWLPLLRKNGVLAPENLTGMPHVSAYWERVQARDSFRRENPYG